MSVSLLSIDELTEEVAQTLCYDCACVFNAREVASNQESYSAGHTYFSVASSEPKSGLEALAMTIFRHHSAGLSFDPLKSGVEWWSQVIEADCDIAFHFDRDYGLEEDEGRHIYPLIATVTYLADRGAPTLVANFPGTTDSTQSLDNIRFSQLYLSFPNVGNHLYFPGDLLHAATTDIMEANTDDASDESSTKESNSTDDDNSVATVKKNTIALETLLSDMPNRRITFLANIWINHIPSQAEACSDQVRSHLKTSLATIFPLKILENGQKVIAVDESIINRTETLTFNHCGSNFDVNLPLPTIEKLSEEILSGDCCFLELDYVSNTKPFLFFSEDQPPSEDDEESEDDSDKEEKEEDSTSKVNNNKRHMQQESGSNHKNESKSKRLRR